MRVPVEGSVQHLLGLKTKPCQTNHVHQLSQVLARPKTRQTGQCGQPGLSAYVGHVVQVRRLHAARAQLVHPQGGFVLQGGAAGVEGVGQVVVQQAAQRRHVDVGESAQAPGEVGGVVTRSEDAAKLRVEQVLCHRPETDTSGGGS